ncbi:MAG TPA: ATP-binding protein, partial [Rubrivivax sp.]|nr:ATP-binding protein [Rubrivivax sp.]
GVRATGDQVYLDVEDHCGGLREGSTEWMFLAFAQLVHDGSGVGLGLSMARRDVQADGGRLTVQNMPGKGCVFTLQLPCAMPSSAWTSPPSGR